MKKILIICFISSILLSPAVIYGQGISCTNPKAPSETKLCDPTAVFSNGNIETFAFKAVKAASGFFTLIGTMYVIFSGFRMMISQGDAEQLTVAKNGLTWAILGLVLGMLSYVIISATATFIGALPPDPNLYIGNNLVKDPLKADSFGALLYTLMNNFLGVVGIIAILMIVMGGFRYITSGGNEEQAESGKKTLQWAVLGLVIVLMSYIIIRATLTFFGN